MQIVKKNQKKKKKNQILCNRQGTILFKIVSVIGRFYLLLLNVIDHSEPHGDRNQIALYK